MSIKTTREILADLVSFDTTTANSNLPLIDYVRDYLGRLGVNAEIFLNKSGEKANLWATIGPSGPGGFILSGHTDCVPVEGQAWTSDPFTLTERNGLLYGRGASDMKGFLAAALASVPSLASAGLKQPVHLAFSYDEEIGCKCAEHRQRARKDAFAKQARFPGDGPDCQEGGEYGKGEKKLQ